MSNIASAYSACIQSLQWRRFATVTGSDALAPNSADDKMMAEAYEILAAEIDRILSSPYPTQLKGLRDITCSKCTQSDIAKWSLSRPCQVERLADCLLEGLQQWPYVLELVTRLCKCKYVNESQAVRAVLTTS